MHKQKTMKKQTTKCVENHRTIQNPCYNRKRTEVQAHIRRQIKRLKIHDKRNAAQIIEKHKLLSTRSLAQAVKFHSRICQSEHNRMY